MNLQIGYLRTFIAVADTKGFAKAGRQIGCSQSVVSMPIKHLEDEAGKRLFERIGKTGNQPCNMPPDLETVGIENGLPVLPASDIIMHPIQAPVPETIACSADYLIKALREKDWQLFPKQTLFY